MSTNPQLELAFDYVVCTDKNIFLTGKAGTGKTTFLHRVKREVPKRMAVVAPTGVAAINAGGMTIHSLFQLPFGPIVPGAKMGDRQPRFSKKKIALLRSLDLLVIDEISMVRADVLDGIDGVLRRHRRSSKPFGGVQLLMIGDLNQLPPVVKHEEWALLSSHYDTAYFFGSRELRRSAPVTIELTHIYRQSDEKFIGLLNKVRDNVLDQNILATLNSRYVRDFVPPENDGYITLTSHNATAQNINMERLAALPAEAQKFRAKIQGDFPAHAFPTDEELELKTGAQVMFIKNDPNQEKLFFNGKIGQIVRFDEDAIYVKCPDDAEEIAVTALEWSNTKYSLNEKTKEVESDVLGTFTQYPLKLAWAITIHKSQGLTFERAIIDAEAAFAHGQVYVALSRCKSFEGIVLRSRINYSSVKTDGVITKYNAEAAQNAPDETDLENSKTAYQKKLVHELFDFENEKFAIASSIRFLFENAAAFQGAAFDQLNAIKEKAENDIFSVAKKFRFQLNEYMVQPGLPENNNGLQERIKKASDYFFKKLNEDINPMVKNISLLSDNQAAKKKAKEKIDELRLLFFVKNNCLKKSQNGFSANEYIRTKANADIDFSAQPKREKPRRFADFMPGVKNAGLYARLSKWRNEMAEKENISPREVVMLSSMLDVSRSLPTTLQELKNIKGIGKKTIEKYGEAIVNMVEKYNTDKGTKSDKLDFSSNMGMPKKNTREISFEMLGMGKTVPEIAQERQLTETTIQGHLTQYIKAGELDIYDVLPKPKVDELLSFLKTEKEPSVVSAKEHFGVKYSYGEIRMVVGYMASNSPK